MKTLKGFFLFLTILVFCSCNNQNTKEKEVPLIGIQPYGNFDKELLARLSEDIRDFYGMPVTVLESAELPEHAFIHVKSPRFRADSLLKHLRQIRPDTIDYILGLTVKDISTTKRDEKGNVKSPASKYEDFGIFGLGYCPGNASVVSTFRYKNVTGEKFYNRLLKICLHELGHNFGLKHCATPFA
jgi:archaemetzincin